LNLAPSLKLKGLNEKWILKQTFAPLLPNTIIKRNKQPYRGPIQDVIKSNKVLVENFTNTSKITADGLFNANKVELLKKKLTSPTNQISAREEMAIMAILTTSIFTDKFLTAKNDFQKPFRQDQWLIIDRREKNNVLN
jgi:asparagine synthase (glutamine-hydrolysing)